MTEPTDEEIAQGIVTDFFSTMSSQGACLSDRIESALRSARLAERERCAKVAEAHTGYKPTHGESAPLIATIMNDHGTRIAAAIRETDSDV